MDLTAASQDMNASEKGPWASHLLGYDDEEQITGIDGPASVSAWDLAR